MILTALAVAAALTGATPASGRPPPSPPRAGAERTPNLYRVPERCKDSVYRIVDRFGRPLPEKLGDLPKGALLYAVDRRIEGCPVLVVVYGEAKPDDPNPPPQDYRFNGAKPATPPAMREDAPSNRR